ncbi:MAG: flagellar biosynthesis protein FlhF, partial [Pseudomonadota bacterium]|nr:flagellar biosynthesis protein FlhF [Pseudomonadota bacterium]
ASTPQQDAARLEMSTLSFQDYVRRRMLRRRQAVLAPQEVPTPVAAAAAAALEREATATAATAGRRAHRLDVRVDDETSYPDDYLGGHAGQDVRPPAFSDALAEPPPAARSATLAHPGANEPIAAPGRLDRAQSAVVISASLGGPLLKPRNDEHLLAELQAMKGMIEERFGALAFMERLQRRPVEARLTQRLLDCGFSPALVRRIAGAMPADIGDENEWVAQVLEKNVRAAEAEPAVEERSGIFALIGATGVGKTTTTAKIAAAFAARHGAGQLGLVTLDAYRVGAHEQLRAYGRILGVPVHTAHDRASLEDLLELLSAKKMVLIDTAGMAQRDTRTQELLEMLSHREIQRLLVVNAAAQGETTEDVIAAYKATTCTGVVLSKIDEAVKLGPTLDAAIRHKLRIVGSANGQRVPEDWHRLSANALVQRALRGGGSAAWKLDACETQLIFAAPMRPSSAASLRSAVAA